MSNARANLNAARRKRWAVSVFEDLSEESEPVGDAKRMLIDHLKQPQELSREVLIAAEILTAGSSLTPTVFERQCRNQDESKLTSFVEAATTREGDRLTGFLQPAADKLHCVLGVDAQERLTTFCESLKRLEAKDAWSQSELELLAATLRIAITAPQKRSIIRSTELSRIRNLDFQLASSWRLKRKIDGVLPGSVALAEPLFSGINNFSDITNGSKLIIASPVRSDAISFLPYSEQFGKTDFNNRAIILFASILQWVFPLAILVGLFVVFATIGAQSSSPSKNETDKQKRLEQQVKSIMNNSLRDFLVSDDEDPAAAGVPLLFLLQPENNKSIEAALKESRAKIQELKQKWRDQGRGEDEVQRLAIECAERMLGQSTSPKASQEKAEPSPALKKHLP